MFVSFSIQTTPYNIRILHFTVQPMSRRQTKLIYQLAFSQFSGNFKRSFHGSEPVGDCSFYIKPTFICSRVCAAFQRMTLEVLNTHCENDSGRYNWVLGLLSVLAFYRAGQLFKAFKKDHNHSLLLKIYLYYKWQNNIQSLLHKITP